MTICIVDTSVFCNILGVPGRCQNKQQILKQLRKKVEGGWSLLLPLAAIVETGNHIAHVDDGNKRRNVAKLFVEQVKLALRGDAPWVVTPLPDVETWSAWLDGFPDQAMRGISLGDMAIIKTWEQQCDLHKQRRVMIWSLDKALQVYDRRP